MYSGSGAWVFHPSDLLNSRWHEQRDYDNVQALCIIDHHQEITAILNDNELNQMPDWIHPPQSNDHVLRGAHSSANHTVRSNVADCPIYEPLNLRGEDLVK